MATVVIGGGLVGLSTAQALIDRGEEVLVIEANEAVGSTGTTAASSAPSAATGTGDSSRYVLSTVCIWSLPAFVIGGVARWCTSDNPDVLCNVALLCARPQLVCRHGGDRHRRPRRPRRPHLHRRPARQTVRCSRGANRVVLVR